MFEYASRLQRMQRSRLVLPQFASGLTVVALTLGGGCRSPSEPGLGSTPIVFTSRTDGQPEQMGFIGTTGRHLTTPARLMNAGGGDWAPDGRRLAFHRVVAGRSQIFVGPVDGSMPPVQITQCPVNCFSPRWSPDGALIAYWSNYPPLGGAVAADSGVTILADTTGANPREIVATRQRTSGYPGSPVAWSPDGHRFAYAYSDGRLFITDLDGSPAVQITLDELVTHPAWSPDGSTIAVQIPAGGIGLVELTNPLPTERVTLVRLDTDNDDFDVAWSPDGRQIVFATFASVGGGLVYHVALINRDGTGRVDLMPGRQANAYLPRWNASSMSPSVALAPGAW